MQPYQSPPQPHPYPPKKRTNTLAIVLAILGVLFVVCVGSCLVCVGLAGHEAKKFGAALAEGGALVTESPPAVKSALAGPKREYVGAWKGANGAALDITADGLMTVDQRGAKSNKNFSIPIAAFAGNDIVGKAIVVLTFHVSSPPHLVGARYEMTVDGVQYSRAKM